MTSLLLAEVNKLKNVQNGLEKKENLVSFLQKFGTELGLNEYFLELERNRQLDLEKNNLELQLIFKSLVLNKKLLEDLNGPVSDLKTFKKAMIVLQENIQSLKLSLSREKEILRDQQKILSDETETFSQKIDEWSKPVQLYPSTNFKIKQNLVPSNTSYKEAKQFMDFVNASNGHENGWSSEDHQLFLKIRKKNSNIDNIVLHLHQLLPDLDEQEIRKHETWYTQYLLLKKQMKEAVNNWRESKQKNCPQETTQTAVIKKNCSKTLGDVKAKIAVWKVEREEKRQREEEFEQLKQQRLKQLQQERRKLQEEIKESVEKWKTAKYTREKLKSMEQKLMKEREKKTKAIEANKMIKQFRSQDDIFLLKLRKRKQNEKKEVKRSKSSYVASRDPDRIFKPTKQWLHRSLKKDNFVGEVPCVPNIRSIPKLRIPDWRKKMQFQ